VYLELFTGFEHCENLKVIECAVTVDVLKVVACSGLQLHKCFWKEIKISQKYSLEEGDLHVHSLLFGCRERRP